MTVAPLGFAIDSGPLAATTSELDKLTSAAARTEQAATKVSGAGTRMSRGFADLTPTLDKIVGSLGRLEAIATSIDKRLDAMSRAAGRAAKANQVMDRSAIEASTAYKQLEASLNAVTAAQKRGDASLATSLAQVQKQKDAIAALNAELQKLRAAPAPSGNSRPAPANSNFQTGNIVYQAQDVIAQSISGGVNPAIVGFQQGPQAAMSFAGMNGKQALSALGMAATQLVSPVNLAAIGLTAAASAAIGFGAAALSGIGNANSALEKHDAILKGIKDRYDAAAASGTQYGQRTQAAIAFSSNQDQTALQKSLETGLKTFAYRATPNIDMSQFQYPGADVAGITQQAMLDQFGGFTDIVTRFINEAREGKGDVLEFNRQVQDLANTDPSNKAMQRIATTLLGYTEAATKAAQAQKELNDQQREFTLMTSRTDAARNAQQYQAGNTDQAFYRDRRFAADVAAIGARSPRDIAEAERRRLEAEPVDPGKESPENRAARIAQQVELAYRRANQSILDAQRDRSMNLDKILQDQQTEVDLVGKTGGAAAALRKEYELTSALRLEAARQGIDVDQKELDLIHERTQALGQLVDQYSQAKFNFDMNQQAGDARLSPRQRQIATTLRQYGLPEDLNGANAQRIGQQLDWQEAKDLAKGFGSAFGNELVSGSHDLGKALLKGLQSSLENEANKLWEKFFDGVGTMFADWLTGSSSGGTGGRAIGSVAAAIGGTAANNNVAGGFSGLAKVIPVTRSALPDVSATTDVASYIAKAASARGIDPNVALAVAKSEGGLNSWNLQSNYVKNGVREPSFGPFQLYKGGGLGNDFMRQTGLDPALAANGPAGVDFALDHAAKNGWGAWYGAGKAGISNWQGIGTGGAATATDAVNKLAESAGAATKGLDTFGGGLGKIGESLSTSFFPAAPSAPSGGGGGGLFGWLGSLFTPNFSAMGGQAALAASGKFIGMYADGTNYAPGGMAIVGERGPELVNLPQGAQVFNANKTAQMLNGGQQGGGIAGIRVYMDDDLKLRAEVENISERKAQTTSRQNLAGYKKTQERGGFGRDQQTYMKRKG